MALTAASLEKQRGQKNHGAPISRDAGETQSSSHGREDDQLHLEPGSDVEIGQNEFLTQEVERISRCLYESCFSDPTFHATSFISANNLFDEQIKSMTPDQNTFGFSKQKSFQIS